MRVLPFSKHNRVRLTKEAKRIMAVNSAAHIQEFGGRHIYGKVIGWMFPDYPSCPEVDVRWYPSNLRYAYNPSYLERA